MGCDPIINWAPERLVLFLIHAVVCVLL